MKEPLVALGSRVRVFSAENVADSPSDVFREEKTMWGFKNVVIDPRLL